MKKLKLLIPGIFAAVWLWIIAGAYMVSAQAPGTQTRGLTPPTKPTGLPGNAGDSASGWILNIINISLAVVGIIAVAVLVYGGFRYITSAGNEEAAESGKKAIQNAIIGLVVVIFSYVIVTVIMNALRPGGVV